MDRPRKFDPSMRTIGLVVPKGVWHRVDILEPSQIVYVTPGPNDEFRPLGNPG